MHLENDPINQTTLEVSVLLLSIIKYWGPKSINSTQKLHQNMVSGDFYRGRDLL